MSLRAEGLRCGWWGARGAVLRVLEVAGCCELLAGGAGHMLGQRPATPQAQGALTGDDQSGRADRNEFVDAGVVIGG